MGRVISINETQTYPLTSLRLHTLHTSRHIYRQYTIPCMQRQWNIDIIMYRWFSRINYQHTVETMPRLLKALLMGVIPVRPRIFRHKTIGVVLPWFDCVLSNARNPISAIGYHHSMPVNRHTN